MSAFNTCTYELVKSLVPILNSFTSNGYAVKDSFAFIAEEIVEEDSEFFMGSLDVDFLFTDIPFEETIDICTNTYFANNKRVEGWCKIEFKKLFFLLDTKESFFIFNGSL